MKLSKPPCNLPGIGVFGCNKLSEFLVNCLIKNDFRITAVWSDRLEQAQAFAQRFKIDFYTDKMDVLLLKKEVELILINCDQALYVQIVSKAFRIGESRLTIALHLLRLIVDVIFQLDSFLVIHCCQKLI